MNDKNRKNLGIYLRQKRESLGADIPQFARFLGMRESQCSNAKIEDWENGLAEPSRRLMDFIDSIPDFRRAGKDKALFKFIDLFAGIGGVRIPFDELGGECVFTSEWDKFAQRTYAFNFGEIPHGDITKIGSHEIPSHDLLLAGFPCQAFSQAGLRRGFADTRGTLFFEVHRILAHHRPRAFLLENVKQLRGHDKGRTLQTILNVLRGDTSALLPDDIELSDEARDSLGNQLNYDVDYRVLSSNHFGVPQRRERIYIVGFEKSLVGKDGEGLATKILDSVSDNRAHTRLGDVLEEGSKIRERYTISDRLWEGHQRRLIKHRAKGNGFGFSLFNKESEYCNTISARYYKDGSEILIDQSHLGLNPRKLTPRECARIQGFPESFNLRAASDPQLYKQFGNSVSVPVIRAIAAEMVRALANGND
jgi:DNA (cytosine-5)-methyltransferase 1